MMTEGGAIKDQPHTDNEIVERYGWPDLFEMDDRMLMIDRDDWFLEG
jgi:hypothetical protein